jgi:threonylcarbamoyladenosine tRNA methylthiotransferase MtaB
MAEDLAGNGVGTATEGEAPDVVVINTCTVTREATKASRMAIRRAVKSHPDAKVVVVGCYAVSDRDEVEAIEGVDVVVGNDEKERLAEVLGGFPQTKPLLQLGMRTPDKTPYRVRANLKIQTGCDEWCSFCIIPTTRGPLRSLEEDSLLAEARTRVAAGARELVLTGVHLGKYTYDTGGDERRLVDLFRKLLEIDGLWRVRLSSILSRHLTDELLSFMSA